MKKIGLLLFAIAMLACNNQKIAVTLNSTWKFSVGDSLGKASPDLDDEKWASIKSGDLWENQGFPEYNGIAWYRQKVFIPSSLVKTSFKKSGIKLVLGKIDDQDQVYLNGKLIGETGNFNSEKDHDSYDKFRSYVIPANSPDIKWDAENMIAIRVNDLAGGGGLYAGPYELAPVLLDDIIKIEKDSSTFVPVEIKSGQPIKRILNITNLSSTFAIPIKVKISVKDFKENEIYTTIIKKEIDPGKTIPFEFAFQTEGKSMLRAFYSISSLEKFSTELSDFLGYAVLNKEYHAQAPVVEEKIKNIRVPFDISQQKISGYLGERIDINTTIRLLNVDETALLEGFYNRPGKHPWIGEHIGKFLHAASIAYVYSKNSQLKTKLDRTAEILIGCQTQDGYLGTYSKEERWTSWDVWSHKYNIIGLLTYYSISGYKPALEASEKMGDLLCHTFGTEKGKRDIIKSGTHVGMAATSVLEAMVLLYRYTDNKKYLDFCNYIIQSYEQENGPKVISTLLSKGKVNETANAKAYEMLSNLVGIIKLYQITGDEKLLKACIAAWNDIIENQLYITGSTSYKEHFHEDHDLPAGQTDHIGEGCVTVTWIQFNQALFNITGDIKFLDQLEKTIYNHLLAAENPQSGCVSYYTCMQGHKEYSCNITCCLSSIPRGIAMIPEIVFSKNTEGGFTVGSLMSATINDDVRDKNGNAVSIKLIMTSEIPVNGKTQIKLDVSKKAAFPVYVRVPSWSKNFTALVNGKRNEGKAGEYLVLDQEWQISNKIEINLDMNDRLIEGGASYPGHIAFLHGPQVLTLDTVLNPGIKIQNVTYTVVTPLFKPVQFNAHDNWYGKQFYSTVFSENGQKKNLILVPFAEAGQTFGKINVWIKKK